MTAVLERQEASLITSFWIRTCVSKDHLTFNDVVHVVAKYYWTSDDEIPFLKTEITKLEREIQEMSVLWRYPYITIYMVSEFMERLPTHHKVGIWQRHCVGNYIERNKIGHVLHSYTALCIKIKQRTALAPPRSFIETKLNPYVDMIRSRTQNINGMSVQEFTEDLQFWILEPIFDKNDDIDARRAELANAQNEQLRTQQNIELRRLKPLNDQRHPIEITETDDSDWESDESSDEWIDKVIREIICESA